jgi:hypothetical protein
LTSKDRVICAECPLSGLAFTWPDLGYVTRTPLFGGKWEEIGSDGVKRLTIPVLRAHYVYKEGDKYRYQQSSNTKETYVRPHERFELLFRAVGNPDAPIRQNEYGLAYFIRDNRKNRNAAYDVTPVFHPVETRVRG